MKNVRHLIGIISWWLLLASQGSASLAGAAWEKIEDGLRESEITVIRPCTANPDCMLIGTDGGLLRLMDKHFSSISLPQGRQPAINDIYVNPVNAAEIYAATDTDVWKSLDNAEHWTTVYNASSVENDSPLAVVKIGATEFVATPNGLRYKDETQSTWQKFPGELGNLPVHRLQTDGEFVYAVADADIYQIPLAANSFKKIFSAFSKEADVSGSAVESPLENFAETRIKDMIFSPGWTVATDLGIWQSADKGANWQRHPASGLPESAMNSLIFIPGLDLDASHGQNALGETRETAFAEGVLVAGTDDGAFYLDSDHWHPLYKGMETNSVRQVALDTRGRVYAATDRGVFKLARSENNRADAEKNNSNQAPSAASQDFAELNRPTIQQVQQWAVQYADVHPEKIHRWYQAAKRKAMLPDLSVGLNRSDTELFHWDSGANPDALIKGRDYLDWSVTVSWDLGELIWNPDFTSIDSRSKLLTELREDVLDQVTRLYFERKRVLVEMRRSPELDDVSSWDKQMRIEELTALLDALTGGKFSRAETAESST